MFDVIVVGARCAGSPLAMLLARKGHSVLVVDRASFPSDTLSTHFIQAPGIARLQRWGLLERVAETGSPAISMGMVEINGTELETQFDATRTVPFILAPRRTVLDELLVDAAREAGAEVREGFYLDGLVREDGRIAGIEGRDADARTLTVQSRIVVGADGRNSSVATHVDSEFLEFTDPLCCGYFGYFEGEFPDRAEFRIKDSHCLITFPTNESNVVIATWPLNEFKEIRKSPQEHLVHAYDDVPHMAAALKESRLVGKVAGTADIPNFVRKAWGPGWILVGDAVYHKDPTPADGINDAFRSAEYLAASLDEGLSGRKPMAQAFDEYERRRIEATVASLPATIRLSDLGNSMEDRVSAFMELNTWRMEELGAMSQEAML